MNIEIRKLTDSDPDHFLNLITVFEEVFEMADFSMPPRDYLQQLLLKDTFSVFVAISNDEVIGGLTAYTLESYYTKGSFLYIYDLAVLAKHQRQGIGKKLMKAVVDHYRETSIEEVFVQADLVDDYAVDFYRSTGAREENVVSFSYLLKG
ncbi:GNAT family N-acetyltransferase [Flavitalea sp.]|nr:GNAT family N-acetyltransferase [Flavitalea sp.]